MSKLKMKFRTIEERNRQLSAFKPHQYCIDKKNPLVIWVKL